MMIEQKNTIELSFNRVFENPLSIISLCKNYFIFLGTSIIPFKPVGV